MLLVGVNVNPAMYKPIQVSIDLRELRPNSKRDVEDAVPYNLVFVCGMTAKEKSIEYKNLSS